MLPEGFPFHQFNDIRSAKHRTTAPLGQHFLYFFIYGSADPNVWRNEIKIKEENVLLFFLCPPT